MSQLAHTESDKKQPIIDKKTCYVNCILNTYTKINLQKKG